MKINARTKQATQWGDGSMASGAVASCLKRIEPAYHHGSVDLPVASHVTIITWLLVLLLPAAQARLRLLLGLVLAAARMYKAGGGATCKAFKWCLLPPWAGTCLVVLWSGLFSPLVYCFSTSAPGWLCQLLSVLLLQACTELTCQLLGSSWAFQLSNNSSSVECALPSCVHPSSGILQVDAAGASQLSVHAPSSTGVATPVAQSTPSQAAVPAHPAAASRAPARHPDCLVESPRQAYMQHDSPLATCPTSSTSTSLFDFASLHRDLSRSVSEHKAPNVFRGLGLQVSVTDLSSKAQSAPDGLNTIAAGMGAPEDPASTRPASAIAGAGADSGNSAGFRFPSIPRAPLKRIVATPLQPSSTGGDVEATPPGTPVFGAKEVAKDVDRVGSMTSQSNSTSKLRTLSHSEKVKAVTSITSLVKSIRQAPYQSRLGSNQKVCMKLATGLSCSDLPNDMANHMQDALNSIGGPTMSITSLAVRPGCVMIAMDVRTMQLGPMPLSQDGTNTPATHPTSPTSFKQYTPGSSRDALSGVGRIAQVLLSRVQQVLQRPAAAGQTDARATASPRPCTMAAAKPQLMPHKSPALDSHSTALGVPVKAGTGTPACAGAVVQVQQQLVAAEWLQAAAAWTLHSQLPQPAGASSTSTAASISAAVSMATWRKPRLGAAQVNSLVVASQCKAAPASLGGRKLGCVEGGAVMAGLESGDAAVNGDPVVLELGLAVQLMGLDVGGAKGQVIRGWKPPHSWAPAAPSGTTPTPSQEHKADPAKPSKKLQLLVGCNGRYMTTRVVQLQPSTATCPAQAKVLVELPASCLAWGAAYPNPSALLPLEVELWQAEVLLSSTPLLTLPQAAPPPLCSALPGSTPAAPIMPHIPPGGKPTVGHLLGNVTGAAVTAQPEAAAAAVATGAAEVLPRPWWWGASDGVVEAAVGELRDCADALMQQAEPFERPMELSSVAASHLDMLKDLSMWLSEAQRALASCPAAAPTSRPDLAWGSTRPTGIIRDTSLTGVIRDTSLTGVREVQRGGAGVVRQAGQGWLCGPSLGPAALSKLSEGLMHYARGAGMCGLLRMLQQQHKALASAGVL